MEESAAALPAGRKQQVKSAATSSCRPPMGLEEPTVASSAALATGWTWRRQEKTTAAYQGWALLDPSVVEEMTAANSTGLALCKSSDDRDVRVSLNLAKPPATSYVQMNTDANVYDKPTVLAADGDLLLIHMVVAVPEPPPTSYHDNFFAYKAHPSMGWLRRLPEFGEWGAQARHFGISRHGSEDYVVAALQTSIVEGTEWGEDCEEVGQLSRYSSSREQWEVIELPIPYDAEKGLYQLVWDSDDLFTFGGVMFWVDYHRGILSCDVFAQQPFLQFFQLPGISVWDQDHDYTNGRQLPRAYRTVGVCRGEVKFVDIDDGLFGTRKQSGFTITTWALKMDELEWNKESVLQVDDLWSSLKFRESPLPRWVPEFPIVSKQNPGIYHFILRGPRSASEAWVITLDMRNMEMESYRPFTNERKLVFEDSDLDTRRIFFDTPFVSCDFDFLDTQIESGLGTIESKKKTALQSDTERNNAGASSSDELDDSLDDDSDDVSAKDSDGYGSDSSEEHSGRLFRVFLEVLGELSVEETNNLRKMWHCPACRGGPGALKWYNGIPALVDHARAEKLQRVNLHKKFAALLEVELSHKIDLVKQTDEQLDESSVNQHEL